MLNTKKSIHYASIQNLNTEMLNPKKTIQCFSNQKLKSRLYSYLCESRNSITN